MREWDRLPGNTLRSPPLPLGYAINRAVKLLLIERSSAQWLAASPAPLRYHWSNQTVNRTLSAPTCSANPAIRSNRVTHPPLR